MIVHSRLFHNRISTVFLIHILLHTCQRLFQRLINQRNILYFRALTAYGYLQLRSYCW
jgi:hypothetical protein